jgi:uncharacterized RDD family membrane protein YckC
MDSTSGVQADPLAPPPVRVICGFWRRIVAVFLDSLVLGAVGMVSGLFLFDTYASMGGWGRLLGFAVALIYFGVLNSSIGKGGTFGKRVMGIEVVDKNGEHITLLRSLARYTILGVPFFLNGASIPIGAPAVIFYLVGFVIFGLGGAIAYLYVFNTRTRQSVHDLAVGTFVVRSGGSGEITARPALRVHLGVIGIWLVCVLLLSVLGSFLVSTNLFSDLLSVQKAVVASPDVSAANVSSGESMTFHGGSNAKTSYFQANVSVRARPGSYEAEATEIASIVLNTYPKIDQDDSIVVNVSYGYDIGIARSSITRNFQHSPSEWKALVRAKK